MCATTHGSSASEKADYTATKFVEFVEKNITDTPQCD